MARIEVAVLKDWTVMKKLKKDPKREHRIEMEIVVDAYGGCEQAVAWYYYLEDQLRFPFSATCVVKRAISPLRVGDEVEVLGMAPQEECEHEMFVKIKWDRGGLAVPLSQLKPFDVDDETIQAAEDWRYWMAQGYEF